MIRHRRSRPASTGRLPPSWGSRPPALSRRSCSCETTRSRPRRLRRPSRPRRHVDELDLRVRNHVYRRFVELGRAPRLEEAAAELLLGLGETEAVFRRLHDAHALVLEPDRTEIRMAKPFSAGAAPGRGGGGRGGGGAERAPGAFWGLGPPP